MVYSLYHPITTTLNPKTLFVGNNPYGGNTIQGNSYSDTIYGENTGNLYGGTVGGNTIYGGGGSNTIYGDAYGLYGSVSAHPNTIWADAPNADDSNAVNTIYGNAYDMGGYSYAGSGYYFSGGNTIHDSHGAASYLYGNAYLMTDYAMGGRNTIYALSSTSHVYGDAYQIITAAVPDAAHMRYGVDAGWNTVYFNSANGGVVCGDAYLIEGPDALGTFTGGSNHIWMGNQQNATDQVYGSAQEVAVQNAYCGGNFISSGSGNDGITGSVGVNWSVADGGGNVIYGGSGEDGLIGACYYNHGNFVGGDNTIHAGSGYDIIFGDCGTNYGRYSGGHNTIFAGSGTEYISGDVDQNLGSCSGGYNTIFAGSGTDTIWGDCTVNNGNFSGGFNTIHAGSGTDTIWGGQQGHDTFVFTPGTGQVTIEDFDHHAGSTFSHAQGDVIDLSAYHLRAASRDNQQCQWRCRHSFAAGPDARQSDYSGRRPPAGPHSERFPPLMP